MKYYVVFPKKSIAEMNFYWNHLNNESMKVDTGKGPTQKKPKQPKKKESNRNMKISANSNNNNNNNNNNNKMELRGFVRKYGRHLFFFRLFNFHPCPPPRIRYFDSMVEIGEKKNSN